MLANGRVRVRALWTTWFGRRRDLIWLGVVLGLLVVLVASNSALLWQWRRAQAAQRVTAADAFQQKGLLRMLADGARTVQLRRNVAGATEVYATLYWSPTWGEALLYADGLPLPGEGYRYQLWLWEGDVVRAAAGFTVDETGHAMVTLKTPLGFDKYRALWITREPIGGSDEPTTVPIAVAENEPQPE